MAKKISKCPFSGKGCKNCPLYRSKHYTLCFNAHYQESIDTRESINESIKGSILRHGFHSLGHHTYQ